MQKILSQLWPSLYTCRADDDVDKQRKVWQVAESSHVVPH